MASKYDPLRDYLAHQRGEVTLTLEDIKRLVPGLANSAGKDNRWWINGDQSHSHCRAWGDAGYTAHPDLPRGRVTFRPAVGYPSTDLLASTPPVAFVAIRRPDEMACWPAISLQDDALPE